MTPFILFCSAVLLFAAFSEIETDHAKERYAQKKSGNRKMFEEIEKIQHENFLLVLRGDLYK